MKWKRLSLINDWYTIQNERKEQNDEQKRSKNEKRTSLKKHWWNKPRNKRMNYLCQLKTWWNERKQFFNCCLFKSQSSWKRIKIKKTSTSMCETQKRFWKCSRLNCENLQQFERITIWTQARLNDWQMKNQKRLMFCSARKSKKSNNQILIEISENRFRRWNEKHSILTYLLFINQWTNKKQ